MKGDKHENIKDIKENTSIRDTDDWEVVLVRSYAAGKLAAGGGFTFGFRSRALGQYGLWAFVGGGIGLGIAAGWINEPSVSQIDCTTIAWEPLKEYIKNPFSSSNLCNASGRVSIAVAATPGHVGVGLGSHVVLTAIYEDDETGVEGYLFDKAKMTSFLDMGSGSGGVAGMVLFGVWRLLRIIEPAVLTIHWTKPVCMPDDISPVPPPPRTLSLNPPLNMREGTYQTPALGGSKRQLTSLGMRGDSYHYP